MMDGPAWKEIADRNCTCRGGKRRTIKDSELKKILASHKRWVEKGVKFGKQAYLREVEVTNWDLTEENLSDLHILRSNFDYTNFGNSDLSYASLRLSSLKCANFKGCNLSCTDFSYSDLTGANLRNADVRGARFGETNLTNTSLPPPTIMLLASWGTVSEELTIALMRYDCANHPEGKAAFDKWANSKGIECPYIDSPFQRAANFDENYRLWSYGPPKNAMKLVKMLIKEVCSSGQEKK